MSWIVNNVNCAPTVLLNIRLLNGYVHDEIQSRDKDKLGKVLSWLQYQVINQDKMRVKNSLRKSEIKVELKDLLVCCIDLDIYNAQWVVIFSSDESTYYKYVHPIKGTLIMEETTLNKEQYEKAYLNKDKK